MIVEGPDQCAKTEISRALAGHLGVPYFKYEREWSEFKRDPSYFARTVRYSEDFFLSYLRQSGASVVKDRGYPSEWVYSRAFKRTTDDEALTRVDREYAALGATIVFCTRRSFVGIVDDLFPAELDSRRLEQIDTLYRQFIDLTSCRVITLEVDDHDLERQLRTLTAALCP
jgi:hypothetical protein